MLDSIEQFFAINTLHSGRVGRRPVFNSQRRVDDGVGWYDPAGRAFGDAAPVASWHSAFKTFIFPWDTDHQARLGKPVPHPKTAAN
jgi:hypothetical protein